MRGEPGTQQQTGLDQAGELIEVQRADDVRGCRPRTAVTEPGVRDEAPRITARSRQCKVERPRHRAFRPAGIRRIVLASVAQHDRQRTVWAAVFGKYRGDYEQQPANRRGHKVDQIVKARRRPTETPIAWGAMSDHAVERV